MNQGFREKSLSPFFFVCTTQIRLYHSTCTQSETRMPITPLHFGLLAPVNHFFPKKVNNISFVAANIFIDWSNIQAALLGEPLTDHYGLAHTFVGAYVVFALVSIAGTFFVKNKHVWYLGAFWGSVSHILLDMLVHIDMYPFFPIKENPFYMGWMESVSIIMVPFLIWWIYQVTSSILSYIRVKVAKG